MDNTFNTDKHDFYKEIIEGLDLPIIDKELKHVLQSVADEVRRANLE